MRALYQKHCNHGLSRLAIAGVVSICTGVAFAIGIWLRFRCIGSVQIFADELHTLRFASEKSFLWNATHFTASDACIPYTLYNKLLLETTGLTELTLRLPAVLAGTLLLCVVFWYGRKYAGSAVASLVTGFFAVSPYVVYIAREARPYAVIMLLITWSGFILMDRDNGRRLIPLTVASGILALAIYFQPVVFPSVAVLWLSPLVLCAGSTDGNKRWGRNYILATVIGAGFVAITSGPALPSFLDGMTHKLALGKADMQTARNGLLLVHALPVFVPVWAWLLIALSGLIACFPRWPRQVMIVAMAVAVQILTIHVANPRLDHIPWVWLRYWIHLFPLLIVFWSAGVARLAKPCGTAGWLVVFVLLGGYGYYHVDTGNYCMSRADTYPVHPMVMMLNRTTLPPGRVPVRTVYAELVKQLGAKGDIVESPRIYTFPLYGRYSSVHGHAITTAGISPGFAQRIFEENDNFRFTTVFRPDGADPATRPVYWIHHYNIKRELLQWLEAARSDPYAWSQLEAAAYLMKKPLVDTLFGGDEMLERFSPAGGTLLYQDNFVKVFRLR